ncbi:MAG: hypothetical protein JXR49_01765 [Acidobacteria bacterium]|nr:hypothetical protein [Acidobacteriota bacterium]
MRKIILFILAFCGLTGYVIAGDEAIAYSQTYVIFLDGSRAGKEIVTEKIEPNGDLVAETENEIYVTDGLETKRMAYATRMVLKKKSFKIKSYDYRYLTGSTGDSYEVTIDGDEITRTLHRGGETSVVTATFKPDTVILDFNVYHQYDYLVRKYDSQVKGRQLYSDFIPVIGNHIAVALTYIGESNLPYSGGNLPITNYRIEFVGLRNGTISVDPDGRLVRVVIPDQDLEVIREDVLPANR